MALESGQMVLGGKYRIEELIGEGAFAEVYRATHIKLGVTRAIKVLRRARPGVGSTIFQGFRERFALEAQLGAQLDDPHLIRVHDFEEEEDTLHLVMEYAPGGSLATRIAEWGPLPVDEVVQIGLDVAKGLATLHNNQPRIVHRDLKPSNILFHANGRAKVSDLGLAQVPSRSSRRSWGGSLAVGHPGTPEYMSPEQERETGYLQPPSDVYALGCVLFEMLTGRLYKHVRPGTRVRELRTEVPDWLDDLVARCLRKEKEERPWDGEEVIEALDAEQRARREKLAKLYEATQETLRAKRWQQAIRHCDDIAAIDAGYRDVAQLRTQAEAGLQEEARNTKQAELVRLYAAAQTALSDRDWATVLKHCQEIGRLEPGYRNVARIKAEAEAGLREQREAEERARRDPERRGRHGGARPAHLRRDPPPPGGGGGSFVVVLICVG
ncbi:MAG: protein kinase, partial [Ardenticatenia bacterium]|nr:protein kinase [Ardenticatenia bacterium]